MTRYNKPTETTADEIADFADSLRTIAAGFDQQVEFIRSKDLGVLMVPKWSTAGEALHGMASFGAGIQDAIVKAKVMDRVNAKIAKGNENEKKQSKSKIKGADKPS